MESNLPQHCEAQIKVRMIAGLIKEWVFQHCLSQVKENFKKCRMSEDIRKILMLDNCPAHPPLSDLVSSNISVEYLQHCNYHCHSSVNAAS